MATSPKIGLDLLAKNSLSHITSEAGSRPVPWGLDKTAIYQVAWHLKDQ